MNLKDIFNNTFQSLTSRDDGFSFRKLASVVILYMVVHLHTLYVNSTNVLTFLLYDFGFIAVLLGLLNLDRFIQAKWGGDKSETETKPEAKPSNPDGNPVS